ncbi:hypothetical protein OEA41_000786 [Lepraria neglecta]|uniref:FAD-binding FR-type domain-containing protein n=1 Tax=Lepraria neglecta TaxID=209136 RepID=A0AAD9ZGA4_9LECA|nr:hypothetical protein OEA41_000786 [Lepraria neglecta]
MGSTSTTYWNHEERTAAEPRAYGMHSVILDGIDQVNSNFLPGQWLDVHVPGIPQAGGFTITSTPCDLKRKNYLELAVQNSPTNPPAAWLWQTASKILDSELLIRVGGSFVWPPPGIDIVSVETLVFVAGGVGINPLISTLSHLHQNKQDCPPRLEFLYSARKGPSGNISSILFLDRLRSIFGPGFATLRNYKLFVTNAVTPKEASGEERLEAIRSFKGDMDYVGEGNIERRRFEQQDLIDAIGPVENRGGVVAYVCGPPPMTDWAVSVLKGAEGMQEERVLCEKWW